MTAQLFLVLTFVVVVGVVAVVLGNTTTPNKEEQQDKIQRNRDRLYQKHAEREQAEQLDIHRSVQETWQALPANTELRSVLQTVLDELNTNNNQRIEIVIRTGGGTTDVRIPGTSPPISLPSQNSGIRVVIQHEARQIQPEDL